MATSRSTLILLPHQLIKQCRQNQDQQPSSSATTINSHNAGPFDCNICISQAEDPVVTCCGHLYCWPCLFTWVRRTSCCAVCRCLLRPHLIFPIYGNSEDVPFQYHNVSRRSIPPRPAGTRFSNQHQEEH